MGSDFGRSITANSNGGTDHAWGGNYFLAGGNVRGGQILGQYPEFSTDNPAWIDRGRFVPTTAWDAAFNGIAQWLGIRDEASLEYAVPNRGSFHRCDLFHENQLFRDGTCTCSGGCPDSKTGFSILRNTPIPNVKKSSVDDIAKGKKVASIIGKDSTVTSFGCRESTHKETDRAIDRTTEKFFCERSSLHTVAGIVMSPPARRTSIAKGLRLYAQNNCPKCDVVSYKLEGRIDDDSNWSLISEGDLPWIDSPLPRNAWGDDIESTFDRGDTKFHLTSVDFSSNSKAFIEYKVTFSVTRDPESKFIQFAELELPGFLLFGEAEAQD